MGKFSRDKGKRNEYLVRDALRAEGYTDAARVPSSGAAEGFKGDIEFTYNGKKLKVEVKSRANEFKALYEAYNRYAIDGVLPIAATPLFVVANTATRALEQFSFWAPEPDNKTLAKGVRKAVAAYKYLQTCNILVLKDDRKQPLYLVYYA